MLVVIFCVLLLAAFLIMALLMRPRENEKVAERRLAALQIARTSHAGKNAAAEESLLKQVDVEKFAWLNGLVRRMDRSNRLRSLILHANSGMNPGSLVVFSLAAGAGGFVAAYLFVRIVPLEFVAGVIATCAPFAVLKFKAARRLQAFNKALPDAIDLMARALRAGHSLASAIGIIAEQGAEPAASEFDELFKQQNFGLPFREALLQMADRVPSKDLHFLLTAMLVQKETGGNLTEILDRTTHVIRERLRIEGEVRTKTAQGRLTGCILAALPGIMLLLINVADPGYSHVLFSDPLGEKLLYVGAGLIAIGGLLIRKIVKIEV